jgi:hypothetical protein
VLSTRFVIHPGLWINDFVVIVVALWAMVRHPPGLRSRLSKLLAIFWLYCMVHSSVLVVFVSGRSVGIANNIGRITSVTLCGLCFDAFYRRIDRRLAIDGIHRAAIILAFSVIAHSIALNLAGDTVRAMTFLSEFDADCYRRDMNIVGFGRAYGLAFEPYWAAAYLFLTSCILKLVDARRATYTHCLLLFAAVLTAATYLVVFLPVWLLVHSTTRAAKRQLAILAVAVALLAFGVLSFGLFDRMSERLDRVQAGADGSANYRIGPPVRTVLGTLKSAPLVGFGLGNSDLADAAGYDLVTDPFLRLSPIGSFSGVAPIEMLACLGIPGVLFYLAFITSSLKASGTRQARYLWAISLLVASNAYLYPHAQLYLFCIWGRLLSVIPAKAAVRASSRPAPRLAGLAVPGDTAAALQPGRAVTRRSETS